MKILIVASEIYPVAKTGGLADVIYSLTNELYGLGHDVKIVLPGYPQIVENFEALSSKTVSEKISDIDSYEIEYGKISNLRADIFLIRSKRIFENSRKLYSGKKFNEFLRYITLSSAAAKIATGNNPIEWRTEILHAHDWHAGMCFNCLGDECDDISRVFSIHNIAFSGRFPLSYWNLVSDIGHELSGYKFSWAQEFSFLEEALLNADKISTVSEAYAEEIQSDRFGFGFQDILKKRRRDLFGILNGVDYNIWHPEQDPYLPLGGSKFGNREKSVLKSTVQQRFGLEQNDKAIVCSFTNRLTHQKMIDTVIEAIERDPFEGFQFIFHADGPQDIENSLNELEQKNKGRVSFVRNFDEATEHLILGAADVCLSPSRFEPCGLNALYAMRYGALPLVRPVGGFLDTVRDEFSTRVTGTGNGFFMKAESASSLVYVLKRIQSIFRNRPYWNLLVENVKRENFSWRHSAANYVKLYNLAARRRQMASELNSLSARQTEKEIERRLAG